MFFKIFYWSIVVLKKTKNRTTMWSSNPIPGHISKENHYLKRYMHPNVQCSTICNSQDMEAPKCVMMENWIKRIWYVYTMEYYSAIKKEQNNAICSNMDGPRGYHFQSIIQWYHMISLICGVMIQKNWFVQQTREWDRDSEGVKIWCSPSHTNTLKKKIQSSHCGAVVNESD